MPEIPVCGVWRHWMLPLRWSIAWNSGRDESSRERAPAEVIHHYIKDIGELQLPASYLRILKPQNSIFHILYNRFRISTIFDIIR